MAVDGVVAAHRDFEDVSAPLHDPEPMLVVRSGDVGDGDVEETISVAIAPNPFGLAPEAIDTASSLLERRRVPREIVVDDVATLSVKVNSFLADGGDDKDFRQQRRVEACKQPIALHICDRACHPA